MGFAILWIMLFHSGLNLPGVLFAVKRVGCVGVDVFLFLSGFGCAHSFDKDRDTAAFYIRRCKRLYPHYIPVLLIFIILKLDYEGAVGYLRCIFGNITGISYWSTGGLSFNWYIPAIIVLYFIFPILYFIIRKRGRNGFMILFVISVAVGLFYGPDTNLSLSITRFPSFVMGVAAGVHLLEQTKRKSSDSSPVMVLPSWVVIKIYMILSGVSGTIMFICLFVLSGSLPRTFFNLYNALFLITPTVLFVSSGWFSRLDNRNYGKYVVTAKQMIPAIEAHNY
ncbi:MAG: acyltransferase [Lachnospiraceae bacterium]|nr:acyltransferase [Lachnospiraceae bacterium]